MAKKQYLDLTGLTTYNDEIQAQLDGKANSSHNHAASNITSGTLSSDRLPTVPIAKGGTGATTAAGALTNLGVTATAAELNIMDGVTATTTELNYVDGVTSNIQTQLDSKAAASTLSSHTNNKSNPHGVTAAQVGTYTKSEIDTALAGKQAAGSYAASSHTHNYAGSSSAGGAATTALACTGNSATATKATQDASGNVITSTYMTKANPTGTGSLSLNRLADSTVGNYSVAIGDGTTASGVGSYAGGIGTVAASDYQTVIGQYNVKDSEDKYAFIIGNGGTEGFAKPFNAFTVDWGGTGYFQGNMSASNVTVRGNLYGNYILLEAAGDAVGTYPTIDFCYDLYSYDTYTSRITETSAGTLSVSGNLTTGGTLTATGKITGSYLVSSSAVYAAGTGYYVKNTSSTNVQVVNISSNNNLVIGNANANAGYYASLNLYAPNGYINACNAFVAKSTTTLQDVTTTARVQPDGDETRYCGSSSLKWKAVYCKNSTNTVSDLTKKREVKEIDDRYIELFDRVQPYTYMFNNGDRVHTGFISQYVEEAMDEVGLTAEELGFFCKDIKEEAVFDEEGVWIENKKVYDEDGNPEYEYALRYGEYIAIMAEKVKRLEAQYNEKLEQLDVKLAELEEKLG